MINKATPVLATVQRISSLTMIAKCLICDDDLVGTSQIFPNWYHFRTGRGLCFVGIHPSENLIDQFVNNL